MNKRSLIIIILSCLSVVGVCGENNIFDKTIDWAQYYRYSSQNDSILTSQQYPKFVFIGNSITDFWGQWHPDFFDRYKAVSRGISGQTTQEMLSRFQSDVVALKPKYVVILAGVNDIAQNNGFITLPHIVQNIRSMCELAKYNNIVPILCSPLPCNHFFWREDMQPAELVRQLKDLLEEYAHQTNTIYVDFYSEMDDGTEAMKNTLTEDGCHPNLNGYDLMEEIIQPYLE